MVAGSLHVLSVLALHEPAAHADEPKAAASERQAVAAAGRSGEPVEITSRRGETRTVRALPNGRIEIEQHLQPIRTRKGGEWIDIDTALRRSGGAIVPAATTVGLRFSAGGDGPMAQLTRAGRTLALSWPQALPEPTLDGDTAVYKGVAGPDVDLRLRARADGFAHVLVIKNAEAARDPRVAKIALAMSTTGLAVRREDGSGVLRADAPGSGAGVFEAPSPMMWDSSHASPPASGARARTAPNDRAEPAEEPAEGARTAAIDVAVSSGKLTLIPDQRLLNGPDTKFPVFIDPVWTTKKASSWGMVSSGYPNESYYKFKGKSTEGMGRCEVAKDYRCVKNQTKRLFYRMPLPSIKGRYIQNVEFVAYETYAYDCNNGTSVQLWRTSALKSYATWNNTNKSSVWGEHLTSRDVAYCSKTPVEFGGSKLRAHVQDAVNKGHSTITFGLKAYSESSMAWWKRFADDAYLRVQYNNPPKQPDTDTMFANPGTKCVDRGQAKKVNDIPTVYATLDDPDNEDRNKVRGQFTLHWANKADGSDWGEKWTSSLTPALTTGSQHQMELPPTIPEGTLIGWGVRAWDGEQWGPWSYAGAQTGCYFYYDPAEPGKPTITSQEYPNDGEWHGGVGETGRFVISDSEKVADRYRISLNGAVVTEVSTTDGAERVVPLAPDRSGPNIVTVQAFAPSEQDGPTVSYEFRVNTGADPVARFTMDEDAGSAAVTSTGPGRPAWLRGSATLGGEGKHGTALALDGVYGFAESTVPIVDTTESFTVSAWAKPTRYGMSNLLAQSANFQSAFQLGIDPQGKAVFKKPSTDTNDGGGVWQNAMDDTALPVGEWSHLTGVYDNGAAQLRLYVNGQLQAAVNAGTALESHGALQIGRSLYNGSLVNYWPGSIDDVQVFTDALSDEQTQQLAGGTAPSGAGEVAHWDMDEAAGKVRVYSPVAPWKATLHGGAALGAGGREGGALQLDNTAGQYAATERPVVNTLRSFTVSAWVKVDGSATSPTKNFTAVSARGDYKSGFYLKYVEETDRWVFARTAQDSADTGWFQATSKDPARSDEWTHLVGVYDSIDRRLKIYVNGEKGTDSPEVTSQWLATGGLEIGRSQWAAAPVDHWAGRIDEVRVYDRILAEEEIGKMVTENPVLRARWTFNKQPVDGKVGGLPQGAPELTLSAGAAITQEGGWGTLSPAGLMLNPEQGGFAETAEPVVRTDDSFTIAGWVGNQGLPQHTATVFSQAGDNANAFILRYVPGDDPDLRGRWQVEMRNGDDPGSAPLIASHSTFTPYEWAHIAVVYDALNNEVSLYVNGELQETADGVSQEGGVFGFPAENGGLQIGRDKFAAAGAGFWVDAVDDVQVFSTALSEEQLNAIMFDPEPEDSP
jgi:hypothetical protein